jgi:hypothetical protein
MSLTRKQFLKSILGAATGAVGVAALVGCDSSSSGGDASGASCVNNGTTVDIGSNHGHALTVSKADVTAAADKTYDIMGTATHTHSVTITAAMFGMLKNNNTMQMVVSTSGGGMPHTHTITVTCA